MPIIEWTPAPQGLPTPDERLAMVLRFLDRAKVAEVAIYTHGTAVIRPVDGLLALDDLMQRYALPSEGAGSPLGDVQPPVCFDDGSVLFGWESAGQGCALSVLTAAEVKLHMDSGDTLGQAGLWARHQRSLDAAQPKRVAYWSSPS